MKKRVKQLSAKHVEGKQRPNATRPILREKTGLTQKTQAMLPTGGKINIIRLQV